MFRLNRGRAIGILLTGFIVYFLFLSSTNTNGDFRKRTEDGLSRRHGILQGDLSDDAYTAQTKQKLDDILAQQKPLRTDEKEEEIAGVAGRKTYQKPVAPNKEKPKYPVTTDKTEESLKKEDNKESAVKGKTAAATTTSSSSDPGKDFAREKLQEYLKKPIVIFSKSYCPHSKRAKQLLLELYTITPTPFVVELDQLTEHVPTATDEERTWTLGQKIQELLGEITGRRTVPNIIVGGATSIGGNDLIWQMHEEGTLVDKIKELGGKRVASVEPVGDTST